jgi:O-methyltransferase
MEMNLMKVELVDVTHPDLLAPENINRILNRVRPYTMVPDESLIDLAWSVVGILATGVPGDFVECGVWRGGASFLVAELLLQAGVQDRKIWLFDSFEGMPLPEEIDGTAATEWAEKASRENFNAELPVRALQNDVAQDKYSGSLSNVKLAAEKLGLSSNMEFVKGWFNQTLSENAKRVGPISLLRIDCDWHASVVDCLENLYDQVSEAGTIIFDDYYTYDGCAVAVHEFLGGRGLAHQIESVRMKETGSEEFVSARLNKGGAGSHWRHQFIQTAREISHVVLPEKTFILVDQEKFRSQFGTRYSILPFLEKDGVYWGAPANDSAAINEFKRLRESGASHIVIVQSCFWWFKCYPKFTSMLRTKFRCVIENDVIVIFDI